MKRTKLIYILGRNKNELLAYDEYDSEGSGKWFTDSPMMAEEYNCKRACEEAEKEKLDVYMWEITYDTIEKRIIKEETWLQFTYEEAMEWKNNHFKTEF